MLYSMTGFGRAEGTAGNRQVIVEIKSLNGKGFEMLSKLPMLLRAWELDVRSLVSSLLLRGTTDVMINVTQGGLSKPMTVNVSVATFYYKAMQQIAEAVGVPMEDVLPTIMRMPDVIVADSDSLTEEEWAGVREVIIAAAGKLMEHRRTEGASLERELMLRMDNIDAALQKILPLEGSRIERVKERLRAGMKDMGETGADSNRFEQEIIYYLEKMDFTEEKTRLAQHLLYFREVLGSKASDAGIQQIVVGMKDELEKAKEQVLNVL